MVDRLRAGGVRDAPLVVASDLTKTYVQAGTALTAVVGASFEVLPGDRIAVTGPSGSGKSTLLHLIAALDEPTSGRIEWPGLAGRGHLRPGFISFSFQGPSLLPPLSVLENVALPLLLMAVSEDEARAEARQMIERLDLTDVANKLPEELSGGQMQRAGVARALVGKPRLVLADEPTGQLDQDHAQELVDVVLDVVECSGASLVVATHDLSIAARLPRRWRLADHQLETEVVLRSP
jgi:ABC-type lipoprotein export system ATPase subunit